MTYVMANYEACVLATVKAAVHYLEIDTPTTNTYVFLKLLKNFDIIALIKEVFYSQAYESNVSDYDATYALPKKILKMVGFRILINDTNMASICWNMYFWFNLLNVLLATICESINMFMMASVGTFLDLFTMMPCVGYLLVATAKAYKIKRYRSVYENLVYELRDMWPIGRITEEEQKIISEALIRLRFVVKAYFSCNMILGSIFTVPPFISYIRNKAGFDEEIMLPFFYWLPYDPFIGNRFEITIFLQSCHCFLAAGFMLSGDLLFCTFLSHITTQFALLAVRIKKLIHVPIDDQLIESYPLGMYSKYLTNEQLGQMNDEDKEKKLNAELISIILRHRALIRLSSDVENMYSFSLLVNFLNSSIIICFCLFCCAFVEKWNGFLYKMFFITAILQIWILCWYGQKLLDTSTGVADALYNSGWYLTSNKMKKSIFIMMRRSQKHVYVTTYGFSIISLESYSTILKTSWSYFTLLINMYKG